MPASDEQTSTDTTNTPAEISEAFRFDGTPVDPARLDAVISDFAAISGVGYLTRTGTVPTSGNAHYEGIGTVAARVGQRASTDGSSPENIFNYYAGHADLDASFRASGPAIDGTVSDFIAAQLTGAVINEFYYDLERAGSDEPSIRRVFGWYIDDPEQVDGTLTLSSQSGDATVAVVGRLTHGSHTADVSGALRPQFHGSSAEAVQLYYRSDDNVPAPSLIYDGDPRNASIAVVAK
ncbi:MAG: hypothetical protein VX874_05340 [Pseudomonadota bacterium]|nr:hypothetical protein [Pseudomonadota bacterium]